MARRAGQFAWRSARRRMRMGRPPSEARDSLASGPIQGYTLNGEKANRPGELSPFSRSLPMFRHDDRPIERLTLRELLTHAEKLSRDVTELAHTEFAGAVSDFRELSRPHRRKSHFPTMLAIDNG